MKVALVKRGGLLEYPTKDNQQTNHISSNKIVRDVRVSETNSQAKAVMETRAPRLGSKAEYDIVRTASINEVAEAGNKESLR